MKKIITVLCAVMLFVLSAVPTFAMESRFFPEAGNNTYTYYNEDGVECSLEFYKLGAVYNHPMYITEDGDYIYLMCEKGEDGEIVYFEYKPDGEANVTYTANRSMSDVYALVKIKKGSKALGLTWDTTTVFRDALVEYNEKNNRETPVGLYYVESIHSPMDKAVDLYQRDNILDGVMVSVEAKKLWVDYVDAIKVLAVVSVGIMAGIVSVGLIKRVIARFV